MSQCAVLIFNLIYLLSRISAYPFDFSDRECRDMFPETLRHDADRSDAPYKISVSQNMYHSRHSKIEVTLTSTDPYKIKGFLLQARRGDCGLPIQDRDKPIGYFAPLAGDYKTQTINCLGGDANAISNKEWKPYPEIKVNFFAPGKDVGPFYFRATIIHSKTAFWTKIFSEGIRFYGSNNTGMRCPTRQFYKSPNHSNSLSFSIFLILFAFSICIFQNKKYM